MAVLDKFRLDDRVAVITGGGTGLGRAMARAFAEVGATVVLAGRRPEVLEAAAAEITQAGGAARTVPTDVTDAAQVRRLIQEAAGLRDRLDILINGAGIMIYQGLLDFSPEEWDREMATHLRGAYLTCREAVPIMRRGQSGAILNLSSYLGLRGGRGLTPAYSAAKGGVITFTKSLAVEFGPDGIRANALCPSLIPTDINAFVFDGIEGEAALAAKRKELSERFPLRRYGTPEDAALAALYLCSDAAGWVTGQAFVLDGGLSAP